ncbi:methyltransferase [Flavobacteriaceae bacterium F89]|uniref:tRNA1(Val) (adenine(37)-N6)-methyltransferase n=1 Tax=Cerina litoralis TaxID=2874477 RepID=A0AAE3JUZ6_9FLAO|nr:methyltransferase [Cerina litoralis]MCG2462872.1 methyltransferase [Cerina litoralis]
MKEPFKFKQFTIHQGRCAMKVGTDGVLLGAWTPLKNGPATILDIGAGTGLVALMLAQRSDAFSIDAVELDPDAYEQCVENFEASPWADRLFCYHTDWMEFVREFIEDGESHDKYNLIVSNPPFYKPPKTPSKVGRFMAEARMQARFFEALPFEELLNGVSSLLSDAGTFSTIIPFSEEMGFITLAEACKLYPNRITRVKGNSTTGIKRSLLEFSFHEIEPRIEELTIELERHIYTQEYIDLTKDFYLKM